VAGAVFGLVVGVVGAAAAGLHAEDLDGIHPDTIAAANEAHVDVVDLLGAMATSKVSARAYLISVGELVPPPVPAPEPPTALARLADCIIFRESRGFAGAVNPRSGASGLGQFLPSTWPTTPAGRAGVSVFDPVANRNMVIWMLSVGRGREFATIGGC
jgi:hypothetical protein